MPPPRLSVAIVCRDNIATIGRTIESVQGLADEIVAVDSGSTDGTIELLEQAGARVLHTDWKGHVATKQMALDACRGEWILCLDSDESPLPELCESIRAAIAPPAADEPAPAQHIAFEMNRKVFYRGRPLEHAWQPEWRLRLVRRGTCHWAGLDPHDYLEPIGWADAPRRQGEGGGAPRHTRIGRLTGDLRHDSFATFADHFATQIRHGRTMAASLAAQGQPPSRWRLVTSPPAAFFKQLVLKGAWRDGSPGWLAATSAAIGTLAKHGALLEEAQQSEAAGRQP